MVKQLFHIEQENGDEMVQQVLALRVGEKHCCFAITDKTGDRLYSLAYYSVDELQGNPVRDIFNQHEELNHPFYKVLISYDHPQSTLVPAQHYRQEDAGLLLSTLYGTHGQTAVVSESIPDWQVYNVYEVPVELHDWFRQRFAAGKYWHQFTLSTRDADADPEGRLLVDFRTDDFAVLAAAGGKLLLTQTFLYSTPEDVLYYLLKICQQFGLSQQKVQVSLSGLIDKQSVLYKELYQYFIHLEFREARWSIPDSEYPAHFFTSLNDLARCAS